VEYSHDLWWDFAFRGDAPRFMRASVGVSGLLVIFAFWKLLARAKPIIDQSASANDLTEVEAIVAKSPRTSANLSLLGDKRFVFSEDRSSFIMYAIEKRTWVSMGDPVGPTEQWPELIWKYRELCDKYDGLPVFYQVDKEHLNLYLDEGLTLLKIGEEARVPLANFSLEGSHQKGLRSTRNKLQKSACTFEIVAALQSSVIMDRLREISNSWMNSKNASEKGFSLGYFDETYLRRCPIAVVKQSDRVIAFANVWLGADQDEFSIDLMRHEPGGPNGLMDYLFTELFLWGKGNGYRWFNMGMAPLSGVENRPLAPLWNKAIGLVYRHGDHFYSFEGLRQYKEKFNPVWHPKYLASPGGLALPRILASVTQLIGRKRNASANREADRPV